MLDAVEPLLLDSAHDRAVDDQRRRMVLSCGDREPEDDGVGQHPPGHGQRQVRPGSPLLSAVFQQTRGHGEVPEPVHGEIWSCPVAALPQLDSYERVDRGLFRRVAVEASGIPCWTYAAGPALASQLTPDRKLDGSWEPGSS